jgi:hypothetical protein
MRSAELLIQEFRYAPFHLRYSGQFTFPNHQHAPTKLTEFRLSLFVSNHVCIEFGIPKTGACRRPRGAFAASVLMPETTMNKYNLFVFRQNNIRIAGQILSVQAKPVSQSMK